MQLFANTLDSVATSLKENQAIIQELQADPFKEKDNGTGFPAAVDGEIAAVPYWLYRCEIDETPALLLAASITITQRRCG